MFRSVPSRHDQDYSSSRGQESSSSPSHDACAPLGRSCRNQVDSFQGFPIPEAYYPKGTNPFVRPVSLSEKVMFKWQKKIEVWGIKTPPHLEIFRELLKCQPKHILFIPSIESPENLGHKIVIHGPVVAALIGSRPDSRVTIVDDYLDLWSGNNPQIQVLPRAQFRKLFHAEQQEVNKRLAKLSQLLGIDTVVNVSPDYDERVFNDVAATYLSLTGLPEASQVKAAHVLTSKSRFGGGYNYHPLQNRYAAGDDFLRGLGKSPAPNFRRTLFGSPVDHENDWLRDEIRLQDGDKLILINFFGSGTTRSWYHEGSATECIRRLLREPHYRVLLAPALNERQAVFLDNIKGALGESEQSRVHIPSRCSLQALKQMIQLAVLVVSVDTGLVHLSAALERMPLVLTRKFAGFPSPVLGWHPAQDVDDRKRYNVFGAIPSRFSPKQVATKIIELSS